MKFQPSVCALLLAALSPVSAQLVSSHAPTPAARQSAFADATAPMQPVGKPVARVNGTELTDQDLMNTMYSMFPYAKQHNGALPKAMEPEIRAGAMKMMVFEELVYQEATRRKVPVPPAKLAKAEADFRARFESPAQYQQYLQAQFHGSQKELFAKIRRSLLIDIFLKAEVDRKADITPAELKAYYDKNPARFQYGESFGIQTISILPPANATPVQLKEARTRAEDALRQAKETKNYEQFGMLAEKISDDDYRVVMGDHKMVPRDQLAPPVVQVALTLKPDQVSDLIQLDNAYTIIRVNKHVMPGKAKYADVKASLAKELKQRKTEQLRSALDKKLHDGAKIELL